MGGGLIGGIGFYFIHIKKAFDLMKLMLTVYQSNARLKESIKDTLSRDMLCFGRFLHFLQDRAVRV